MFHVDSEISEESEYDPSDETLGERLYALRDIVPPQTRGYIANVVSTASDAVKSALSFGGKSLWVISSSALLLGIPWALAWAEEQQVLEMEKEMKMREMGGDVGRTTLLSETCYTVTDHVSTASYRRYRQPGRFLNGASN